MKLTLYIYTVFSLLFIFAACTQDELADGTLPEWAEGTPIEFTAMGLNHASATTLDTRTTVDGDWQGVTSVAVMIDGTVKTYKVNPTADNTSATLTSDDPYYWTNHADIRVTAWWPYTVGEKSIPNVVVRADQSKQDYYEASDYIAVIDQLVSYGNLKLAFTHRTALLHIVLTDYTDGLRSVQLTGLSIENDNPAVIDPLKDGNSYIYSALVAPQSVAAGTAFITCKFDNGKTLAYKMQNSTEWKAGEEYTYTVSLAAAEGPGYTDDGHGTYTVTTANGLLAWAEAARDNLSLNCILSADIDMTGKEWTPIGKNTSNITRYIGTFDGGGHTITGLTVKQPTTNFVGVIGCLGSGGKVQNLMLENVSISGNYMTGGVVGYNYGTVIACTVSGSVSGSTTSNIGGVVGNNDGTVIACKATSSVSGESYVGGVVGSNYGTVTACYHALGSVSGNSSVGGVAGSNNSSVTTCYWSDSPDIGIGYGSDTTTKVDGSWVIAVSAMNSTLQNAGSEWRYELTGDNSLPTLTKTDK